MVARRLAAVVSLAALPSIAFAESVPPELAAPPGILLAAGGGGNEPVDDSDLQNEETIKELDTIEINKNSWSTGAAVGLSFIPGGGFGLIYAEKKAASFVPFILSVAGYTVGALYLTGQFNTKKSTHCAFTADPNSATAAAVRVDEYRCTYAKFDSATSDDPIAGDEDDNPDLSQVAEDKRRTKFSIDWTAADKTRVGSNKQYYESSAYYGYETTGQKFDGKTIGIGILIGTYAVTTVLGAVWSGLTVSDHNEQVRKDVESTAQTTPSAPKPQVAFDGEQGFFGMAWDF